jgi:glycerol-3-phosphate dehydrogenase
MHNFKKIQKKIAEFAPEIQVSEERGCIVLRGEVEDWATVVGAGKLAVDKKHSRGVINDVHLRGFEPHPHLPTVQDRSLEGERPDVLIVGGGITGCAIARELSKWNLDTILVEKGADVASGASKANGGVIHVGINFPKHSQKLKYNLRGNCMYAELTRQLEVPFEQKGQVMLCCKPWEKVIVEVLRLRGKTMGIPGVRWLEREELLQHEPSIPDFIIGGMFMPSGGITNPMEMTVALAENAIKNGARVFLNTAVLGIEAQAGHILSVSTNRGTLYPKLVINAAGVYADKIAEMAGDRTFTIHPRRGTDIITDKKVGYMVHTSMEKSPFSILPYQNVQVPRGLLGRIKLFSHVMHSNTKGIGLIHSVHGNMLVGPNAIETPEREDTATHREEVEQIIRFQQHIALDLKFSDIIAYFTGVRAPTYEEDFVVRKGIFTDNILEAAGIQSPGITAAPAIAEDISGWAVEYLSKEKPVTKNTTYDPTRQAPPRLAEMSDEERDALIHQNPDYGVIVCRCEEVSKGEILDALNSPLCVPTLDALKRRVRPGMGRCQGGFCSPLVTQIIAEHQGVRLAEVRKSSLDSVISYGETKGAMQ